MNVDSVGEFSGGGRYVSELVSATTANNRPTTAAFADTPFVEI